MFDDFSNKDFRDAFVEENIKNGLAFQIRALREKRNWSQGQLGDAANKPKSVICRLENPEYGKYTLRTLLDLAAAMDVALLVRFVSYSKLFSEIADLSPAALAVSSYAEERSERQAAMEDLAGTVTTESALGGSALNAMSPKTYGQTAAALTQLSRPYQMTAASQQHREQRQ